MDAVKLKQLNKLIKLCRKNGISNIKIEDITLSFEPKISKPIEAKAEERIVPHLSQMLGQSQDNTENDIQGDHPTPEQLLFWSVDPDVKVEARG